MASPFAKDYVADYNKVLKYPKDVATTLPTGGDKKMVWVPYDSEFGYMKAQLVKEDGSKRFCKLDSGEEKNFEAKDVHDMNPAKFEGVEDMSELGYLNEPSVLFNLQQRYNRDLIYTYSGLFLVAINPYKHLPIYTSNIVDIYSGKRRNEVAPHIFAIADTAYRAMLTDRKDQSLLITGESGAGKTENTKKVIQYLATVAGRAGGHGKLEQQLIELNPFLEAFGNAKTCRNNNSSRFGKFIKLEFNHAGNIAGASMKSYLLEKSRVVSQSKGERNYHIFYQLLTGATPEEREKYHLIGPEQYHFLNQSECYTVDRLNDAKEFEHTKAAMATCDIGPDDQDNIYRVISAILWLGNLPFSAATADAAELKEKKELNIVADLLSVNPQKLENALIKPTIMAGRDKVQTHLNAIQAADSRDALVKALYGRLFLWLVNRVNEVLSFRNPASFIGVLDISGFEIFQDNSFEQLCINYTNEKLQQFFNNHMFQLEQDEYEAEKINWSRVDFKIDGQSTIDLIDRKPNGILVILDEESVFPNATDETLLHKLYQKHQHNPAFQKPRFAGEQTFIIKHYAGEVNYSTTRWLEKNKDPLQNDLETCMQASSNRFVQNLFSEALAAGGGSTIALSQRKKGAQFLTVGSSYKDQLADLMNTLRSTAPHFVRCILPNHKQRPGAIEADCVLEQLRCNGVLEGIRITRMGWPNRIKYDEFLKRYYLLASGVPRTSADPKAEVAKVIKHLGISEERVQFGLTKIFFRTGELARIEEQRESKIGELLIVIQSACRGWVARSTYNKLTAQSKSARIIQSNLRNYLDLKDWLWGKLFQKIRPLLKRRNFEAEIEEREKALKETNAQLRKEQEDRAALAASLSTVQNELQGLNQRYQEAEESISALKRAKAALESEKQELSMELDEERANATELAAAKRSLDSRAKDLELQLQSETEQKDLMQEQLNNLTKSVEQLRGTLEDRDSRISALESETTSLKNSLQEAEGELDSKDETIESMTQKEASLKKLLAGIKSELEESEEKAHQLNDQKGKLEARLKKLQSEFDAEVDARGNLDEVSKKLKDQLTQREAELEEERNNANALAKLRKDLEKKLKQTEDDLESANTSVNDLESTKRTLTNKVQELESKVQEDEEQIEELEEHRRKADLTIADLKRRLQEAEATIARLEREKKSLEGRVAELEGLLEEEAKDKQALSRDQKTLAEEIDTLNAQLEGEGTTASKLQKKLGKAERDLKALNEKLREEQTAKSQADNDIQRLTGEVNQLRVDLDESENKSRQLANRKRELETQNEEYKDQIDQLTSSSENLKRQLNNLKKEADELNLQLTEQSDSLEENAAELQKAKRAADQFRVELQTAQDELARSQDAQRALKQQIEEMEAARTALDQRAQSLEKARAKAEADTKDLQKQLEEQVGKTTAAERNVKKLQKKNSQLLSEVDAAREAAKGDLEAQLNNLKEEFRTQQESLEASLRSQREALQERDNLNRELLDARAQLDEASNSKTRLEKQVKNLQEEMDNLSEEIESSVMDKFDDMKRAHSKALDSLRIELDSAQNQARLADDKNKRLTRDLEEITSRADADSAKAASLEKDLANVRTSYEELRRKDAQNSDVLAKAQKDLKSAKKNIERLKQEVADAQNMVPESELRRLNEQTEELNRQLEEERRARANVEREKDNLSTELTNLRGELEEESRAKQTAQASLKKLQFEKDDLSSRLEDEEDEIENTKSRVSKLNNELSEIKNQLRIEQEDRAKVESKVRELDSELNTLRNRYNDLESDKVMAERKYKETQIALEDLRSEADDLRRTIQKQDRTKKKYEKQLSTAKEEAETERKGKSAEAARAASLDSEVRSLRTQLADEQNKARIATDDKRKLETQLQAAERDKRTLKQQVDEAKEDLENERKRAKERQRKMAKMLD